MHRYAVMYFLFPDIVGFALYAFWRNAWTSNFHYFYESNRRSIISFHWLGSICVETSLIEPCSVWLIPVQLLLNGWCQNLACAWFLNLNISYRICPVLKQSLYNLSYFAPLLYYWFFAAGTWMHIYIDKRITWIVYWDSMGNAFGLNILLLTTPLIHVNWKFCILSLW